MSSRRYNFVTWNLPKASFRIPPDTSLRSWRQEFDGLDAIIFMADMAIYKTRSADGAVVDEMDHTLQDFRRVCKFGWLAERDIILFFLNVGEYSAKSSKAHGPRHKYGDHGRSTADDIVKRFVSLNEDESREIHVIFADNDERAKNLECLDGAVGRILSKKAIAARNS